MRGWTVALLLMFIGVVAHGATNAAGAPIHGAVLTPAGMPATGASLVLLPTADPWVFVFGGDPNQPIDSHWQHATAGVDGAITASAIASVQTAVILHPSGYLKLSWAELTAGPVLRLQPWGRVEGTLRVGTRPGVGQTVALTRANRGQADPRVAYRMDCQADAQGHFSFEHVPADVLDLSRLVCVNPDEPAGSLTSESSVEVGAGGTTRVSIGGTGRMLRGKLLLPTWARGRNDWRYNVASLDAQMDAPRVPMPDEVKNGTAAERVQWKRAFLQTEAGRAYLAAYKAAFEDLHSYALEMQRDGTFQAADVRPGRYQLSISIETRPTSAAGDNGAPAEAELAIANAAVNVPPAPIGEADPGVELPPLPLHAARLATVGQPAPEIDVPTLAGGRIKLSDFRGRYVLLDFWATTCTPCLAAIPELRATYAAMHSAGRFTILGMNSDQTPRIGQRYVQKQQIPWPQGWIGDDAGQRIFGEYQYGDDAQFWLVSPDGTVIACCNQPDQIKAAVTAAMSR